MERLRIASPSPWEPLVGFSRAVRAGSHVYVSGTTGTDGHGVVAGPDAYTQASVRSNASPTPCAKPERGRKT